MAQSLFRREQCFNPVVDFESCDHVLKKNFEYHIFGKRIWIESASCLSDICYNKRGLTIIVSELRVKSVL